MTAPHHNATHEVARHKALVIGAGSANTQALIVAMVGQYIVDSIIAPGLHILISVKVKCNLWV